MKIIRSDLPFKKNCEGYFIDGKRNILAKEGNNIILFPGGGVDKDEDVAEAMIRETKEETGAIVKDVKELGTIKILWDEMHFFIGDIEKFEEPDIKEEDFWVGEKLMPIEKVVEIIEYGKPFDEDIREYRETQLKILRKYGTKTKKNNL